MVPSDLVERDLARLAHCALRVAQVLFEHGDGALRGDGSQCLGRLKISAYNAWERRGTDLVADHGVLARILEHAREDVERVRVLLLAEHVRKLVLEQRRLVREACARG